MSLQLLAQLIGLTASIVSILVFIWVVLAWIMPPYHPLREALDRVVEPMLMPIRRVLPVTSPVDFSPMILIILVELLARILISIILSL